jgi:hypothetical protein
MDETIPIFAERNMQKKNQGQTFTLNISICCI